MKIGWDRDLWVSKALPSVAFMAVSALLFAWALDGVELGTLPGFQRPPEAVVVEEPPDPRWFGLFFALALPVALAAGVVVWRARGDLAATLAEGAPDLGLRPPPPPPAVVVPPDDARFAGLVAFGETFEPPGMSSRFDPFRLRATSTGEGKFEALEFVPGAVIVELSAVVHRDGSGFLPGVIEFLGALRTARIPRAFVHEGAPPSVIVALARFGSVHRVAGSLADTLRVAAEKIGVPPEQCAVVVGSAGSVAQAHAAECLAIAVVPPGATALALSGADLVVGRLRAEWIHADGAFRLT